MTVVSTHKDTEALSLEFITEFDAPVERVWQVWEDPRQLERWWGPPSWPATFDTFDFTADGDVAYYMTGPDGTRAHGWWRIVAIDAPHRLELVDGFANEDGTHNDEFGTTRMVATLEETDTGTRMRVHSTFESLEQLEQMVAMGMEEGMRLALGQIDSLLVSVQD